MRNNGRFTTVLFLSCILIFSLCSVGAASSEPNAVELVRAVRESENWMHRIDSLQLRIEGKWTRSHESIAARYAELKMQFPDQEPDPNRSWDLKPSESDILEYAIDFKGERLRHVEETPGREYFLKIWDGKQAARYAKAGSDLQQYHLESDTKMFEKLFGSLSWPRAQPHSFWWEPLYVEERIDYFGRAEDFKITGRKEFRSRLCHVLECISYLDPPVTRQWYVGIKDHLLYGWREWIKPGAVFEFWTLDYKQIAPGCLLPMTQGYSLPAYSPDTKQYYIRVVRDVKVVEAQVNEELSDELFEMKFEEGLTVIDERSGKSEVYNYRATYPSLIGKPLPHFENITIDFNREQAKDRMLLICFFDMNQRPSRHCLLRLGKRAQELKEKEVVVIAVHTSKNEQEKLDEWKKENGINITVGIIEGDEKKIRFDWGVKSLPWLILTDINHIVRSQGLGINELDQELK